MGVVVAVFAVVVLLAVAGLVLAGVLALRGRSSFERDSRLAPHLATSAPTSWAGSHDPEARLHRRLRDAVTALTANQAFDHDGNLLDLRVELEHQAVALDEQLVATAALPLHVRAEPLERIAGAVEALERAVAELAGTSAAEVAVRLDRAVEDLRTRTGLVAQARAALDALDPPGLGEVPPTATPGSPAGGATAPPTPALPEDPTPRDQPGT